MNYELTNQLTICAQRMLNRVIPPFGTWQDLPKSPEHGDRESARWAVLLGRYLAKR